MIDQTLESGDLRVVFHWRGDRFGHTVERRTEGKWQPVLESVEGSADDNWPPSPPLQSLRIERLENGPVALLLGQAGKSHWSASVEPLSDQAGFQFDIACRLQHPPQHLGSAYRSTASHAAPIIDIAAAPPEAICELVANDGMTLRHIRPVEATREYPSTIRWRYTIALDNCYLLPGILSSS